MPRPPAPVTGRQLTLPEVADTLRLSESTVRRMISRGDLRAYRIGRHLRIDPADLAKARVPATPLNR